MSQRAIVRYDLELGVLSGRLWHCVSSVAMTLAMFRCSSLILIFLSWTLVLAQNNNNKKLFGDEKKTPVKRGPDGRPLLFGPDIEKCKTRKSTYLVENLINYLRRKVILLF